MPDNEIQTQDTNSLNRFGFNVAIITAILTVITFVIAVLTPPLSGPFCTAGCYNYPYTDIISRFPRDYFWMYPAMLLMLIYVVFMVCIHNTILGWKRIFSKLGVIFSVMSALVLVIDYFVQVSVIQPSLLSNETDGIALWSQYNPHGLFIVLEELGYLLMSFSFLCMAFVYSRKSRLENVIRVVLSAGFILTILAFIYISYTLGIKREYIFEIIVISINWLVLIVFSILQCRIFRKHF